MSQPVIEPNFEGEEMKIPEGVTKPEAPPTPTKSIVNTTAIILLAIALLAVFAGLGYWYHLVMNTPVIDTTIEDSPALGMDEDEDEEDGSIQALEEVSESDEIEAIEADIEDTELDDLDKELAEIDAEFEAEMETE